MFRVTQDGAILAMIIVLVRVISHHPVNSLGKRSYGESCSFGGHITSFFSPGREERICDRSMGLICTGTCTCPPGRVWDFGATDFEFSDRAVRGCAGAVGSPCIGSSRNDRCVSNAHCQFAFCRCKPNFKSNGRHCVSTNLDGEGSSSDEGGQGQTRPASSNGISFPELQDIFSGFNGFNNPSSNHQNFNNDFANENNFNDRFSTNSDNPYQNERFPLSSDDSYHDHHNSRDGSKGSGSIRFE